VPTGVFIGGEWEDSLSKKRLVALKVPVQLKGVASSLLLKPVLISNGINHAIVVAVVIHIGKTV
jgi:hypothetical protein